MRYLWPLCALLMAVCVPAYAVIETYDFSSEQLQQRYQTLSKELRCPKCQNQDIADSNAPIAQDLRAQLYKQLEEGASDDEILDYMVARYGEFVRYRPRFSGVTAVLWLAPLILLFVAAVIVVLTLRKRAGGDTAAADALDDREKQALQTLLDDSEKTP